jgi:site-specific recombinase XerD
MNWVPPRMVRPRSFKREIPRFLTETQVNSLFRGAKTLRERAILELLYGSGCRMGELLTMRIEDIDFRAHRVRVTSKTGRRFLMITSRVARSLRTYIGPRRAGYVFIGARKFQVLRPKREPWGAWSCHYRKYQDGSPKGEMAYMHIPRGKCRTRKAAQANFYWQARNTKIEQPRGLSPLSSSAVERVLRTVGIRVGINFNARVLRHSIATHLMDNDADIRIVQVVLGHTSMRTTQIYTHICKKHAQAMFEQCHPRK